MGKAPDTAEIMLQLRKVLGESGWQAMQKVTEDIKNNPNFHRDAVASHLETEGDDEAAEVAPWFGTTGLGDELERELPRYLRREFGESIGDEDALRAQELVYLGSEPDGALNVHYWGLGRQAGVDGAAYAYIEIESGGAACIGWGNRVLPARLLSNVPVAKQRKSRVARRK